MEKLIVCYSGFQLTVRGLISSGPTVPKNIFPQHLPCHFVRVNYNEINDSGLGGIK